jgi:quercetin dioxygenase-like cupin family protein
VEEELMVVVERPEAAQEYGGDDAEGLTLSRAEQAAMLGGGVRSERPELGSFKQGELMKAVHVAASSAERVAMPEDRGSEVWLANASLTGASLSVIRLLLRPGQSGGRHRHPNADEVICLFRGMVRVHTPTEAILLRPGDGLTVLAGLTHQIENVGSEDAEMSLSYSSGDRRYVAE